jgi:hypothetical protein
MPKAPTPALIAAVVRHLSELRAAGVRRAEFGPILLEFDAPGAPILTDTTSGATVPSTGQLSLALASAAPAAQLEAPTAPDAPAAPPAKPATDDAPDDLDLGHLG